MGRGLSDLQKGMMRMAWDELRAHDAFVADAAAKGKTFSDLYRDRDNWCGYVCVADVFRKFYGWIPVRTTGNFVTGGCYQHHFSKSEIGEKKYMAAYIAVHKALDRLVSRGLVSKNGGGRVYSLTIEGETLTAKQVESETKSF